MRESTMPVPGLRMTLQRRWLLSVLAVVVLLQGAIFAVVDPELSGWHPHHGHVHVGGMSSEHTHPWDSKHGEPVFGATDASEQAVGFTGGDEFGSIAGTILPAAALLPLAVAGVVVGQAIRRARVPRAALHRVPVPPPRS